MKMWLLLLFCHALSVCLCQTEDVSDCLQLELGQYICDDPLIDTKTQLPKNCNRITSKVNVTCHMPQGLTCKCGTKICESTFLKEETCEITNGHKFETALLLSIFLGMFGIDRFYLGYPAIGLLKFCTLGFMFLGQLVDILLIAMQVVGPADNSSYVIDYYGAKLTRLTRNDETDIF